MRSRITAIPILVLGAPASGPAGIRTVTSSPPGILCGTECQACRTQVRRPVLPLLATVAAGVPGEDPRAGPW